MCHENQCRSLSICHTNKLIFRAPNWENLLWGLTLQLSFPLFKKLDFQGNPKAVGQNVLQVSHFHYSCFLGDESFTISKGWVVLWIGNYTHKMDTTFSKYSIIERQPGLLLRHINIHSLLSSFMWPSPVRSFGRMCQPVGEITKTNWGGTPEEPRNLPYTSLKEE